MQFKREYNITVGNKTFKYPDFELEFDVELDNTVDLNHAEVIIYNLSLATIKSFKNKAPIIVNAGYNNDVGSIFLGAIYDIHSEREGVDRKTTIKAVDGADQRKKLNVNRSYKAGTKTSQIITDLCRLSGLSIAAISLPKDITYSTGKNINGQILTILKQLAKDCGAKFHISKGMAYFTAPSAGQKISFVFSARAGLIGLPEPFLEEDEKGKELKGYNLTTLLNHRVQADSIITIKTKEVQGQYRVIEARHILSGKEMKSELKVI